MKTDLGTLDVSYLIQHYGKMTKAEVYERYPIAKTKNPRSLDTMILRALIEVIIQKEKELNTPKR